MNYIEKETKVLNINVQEITEKLKALGAKEVFNDKRIITHFDSKERTLIKEEKNIKLTEEGKLKLSWSGRRKENGHETVKLFVSRKQEAIDFMNRLGFDPISESTSHRISFEWEGVDFDIDEFSQIPAFLEIDLGDSKYTLQDILQKLNLEKNEMGEMSTPEIYKKYGFDYFDLFKL
jgi:adenylate cyclase class IV